MAANTLNTARILPNSPMSAGPQRGAGGRDEMHQFNSDRRAPIRQVFSQQQADSPRDLCVLCRRPGSGTAGGIMPVLRFAPGFIAFRRAFFVFAFTIHSSRTRARPTRSRSFRPAALPAETSVGWRNLVG